MSDDVESSANVERNFQRLVPSMHAQAANEVVSSIPDRGNIVIVIVG